MQKLNLHKNSAALVNYSLFDIHAYGPIYSPIIEFIFKNWGNSGCLPSALVMLGVFLTV